MRSIPLDTVNFLMDEALLQAKLAADLGEVPVGAVIYKDQKIITKAHNLVESEKDASRHAEIIAIQQATKVVEDWRLNDTVLCVTLEPCTMCAGAIKLARIPNLIFGAFDPERGACGSLFDLTIDKRLGPVPNVVSGVKEEESIKLLKDFFQNRR